MVGVVQNPLQKEPQMGKVGEVTRMSLYRFADGTFSFHTAYADLGDKKELTPKKVFRVKMSEWPSTHARENNISYKLLMNSSPYEIKMWLENHPEHELKEVKPLP